MHWWVPHRLGPEQICKKRPSCAQIHSSTAYPNIFIHHRNLLLWNFLPLDQQLPLTCITERSWQLSLKYSQINFIVYTIWCLTDRKIQLKIETHVWFFQNKSKIKKKKKKLKTRLNKNVHVCEKKTRPFGQWSVDVCEARGEVIGLLGKKILPFVSFSFSLELKAQQDAFPNKILPLQIWYWFGFWLAAGVRASAAFTPAQSI